MINSKSTSRYTNAEQENNVFENENMTDAGPSIQILDKREVFNRILPLKKAADMGVEACVGGVDSLLIYELKLPLKESMSTPYAILSEPGKIISFFIQLPNVQESASAEKPAFSQNRRRKSGTFSRRDNDSLSVPKGSERQVKSDTTIQCPLFISLPIRLAKGS